MTIQTKSKIIYGTKATVMLFAIFAWWRYTERTVWGFLGLLIVGMIAGGLLGWIITLPFKDEEPTAEENYYCKTLRYLNSMVQLKVAQKELEEAEKPLQTTTA